MKGSRINYLLDQYATERCTAWEKDELMHLFRQEKDLFINELDLWISSRPINYPMPKTKAAKVLKAVLHTERANNSAAHRIHFHRSFDKLRTTWLRYAAAIIIILGTGAYFWFSSHSPERSRRMLSEGNTERSPSADIAPGTNKAILSIGTNKTIDLSANKTGINVNKTITYNDGEKIAEADQMLVLTTPRGGQYQAILPDGTKVWLNAESSIRFPSKFDGAERRIELTGEVYLEIAQDKSKPFFVTSKNTNIQVLGTSFNVNSYTNEPATKTTLLEGSIRIDDKILNPGEAYTKGKIIKATIAQDIAWKNGLFNFDGADLHSVMRQLERWYNISVEYRGNINNEIFKGQLSRDLTLAQLTRILEEMDIKFIIDGRKLIVTQ